MVLRFGRFLPVKISVSSQQFILALGKVPGPEAESVSREGASLSKLFSEEAVGRAQRRKDVSSQQSNARGIISILTRRGLLSLCPIFLN